MYVDVKHIYKAHTQTYTYTNICCYHYVSNRYTQHTTPPTPTPHTTHTHRRVGKWDVVFSDATHFGGYGTHNTHCLADLLLSFFDYWTWKHDYQHDVASIRVASGRLSKAQKQWTVRVGSERHLICIEVWYGP